MQIVEEFQKQNALTAMRNSLVVLPLDCGSVPLAAGRDFYETENAKYGERKMCWMEEPKFRSFFPEYRDLTQDDLVEKMYTKAGIFRPLPPEPWHYVGVAAFIGLGIPGVLLLVGTALFWALSGFRRARGVVILSLLHRIRSLVGNLGSRSLDSPKALYVSGESVVIRGGFGH